MRLITYFIACTFMYSFFLADVKAEKNIQTEIKKLDSSLQKAIDKFAILQQDVSSLEKKLGRISRQKHITAKKIKRISKKLITTNTEKKELEIQFSIQKSALAQQLQAFHSAGTQSHLRLLLRQDNPSDITRTFKYFEYLYQNRAKKITQIKGMMRTIDTLKIKINRNKTKLQQLRIQYKQQEQTLKNVLVKRSKRVKTLNGQINSKKRRLNQLKKQEAKLQQQVEKIANRSLKPAPSASNTRKTPPVRAKIVQTRFTPNKPFSTLRGKLSWPVRGKIIHAYRSKRNEKQHWRGVVIKASGGQKVRAIAKGRIGFSGWMNGYGYIVMIEHDKNYISVYGYNRTVYKKEGAIVNANTVIAAVGNSGGQSQNALYFEIRKGKTPQNPARWCR